MADEIAAALAPAVAAASEPAMDDTPPAGCDCNEPRKIGRGSRVPWPAVEPSSCNCPAPTARAVVPGLYVGPFINARSKSWLTRHKITHVVNATNSAPCVHEDALAYLRVPLDDLPDAPIADHFDACHAFISEALVGGGAVLVHCQMGKSRSATLAAAYVVKELGVSWRDALARVQRARPTAAPNTGFLKALRAYELAMPLEGPGIAELHRLLDVGVDELALVPGPLHDGIFEGSDAAGVLRATAPPVAGGPAMLLGAQKLAIDLRAAPRLLREAQAAWRRARERGAGDDARGRAAKVLALCTLGQCYSAWNERKRLLLAADDEAEAVRAELALSALVLRSFPKAHEAFAHRRWVLARVGGGGAAAQLEEEMSLASLALTRKAANYHAGRHVAASVERLLPLVAEEEAREVLARVHGDLRALSARCPHDASVLYAYRAVVRRLMETTRRREGDAKALRDDELVWCETRIRGLPQHAVLWQHRRVLLAWAAAEGGGGGELEPRWLGAEVVERERALAEAVQSGDERAVVNARRHAQWCEGYAAKG